MRSSIACLGNALELLLWACTRAIAAATKSSSLLPEGFLAVLLDCCSLAACLAFAACIRAARLASRSLVSCSMRSLRSSKRRRARSEAIRSLSASLIAPLEAR